MVASYQDTPLLFLTTTNSFAPTGRNARAQARSVGARRSNPASKIEGTFGTFSLDPKQENVAGNGTRSRKRQRTGPPRSHVVAGGKANRFEAFGSRPTSPLQIFSTPLTGGEAFPRAVNLDDVLKVAAFHIRRRAAQIVSNDPTRMLDALRCRQWCSGSSPLASLGRSRYLDSAIACVVSKVHEVVSGTISNDSVLRAYARALHQLRVALVQPALHDRLDMFAATQLLAIYEMLDFPNNGSWAQHVAGASAIAKIQGSEALQKGFLTGHVVPMFVESLVNDDDSFFNGQHWRSLLHLCVTKQYPSPEANFETIGCLTAMREVFSKAFAIMHQGTDRNAQMDWPTRLSLLSRAHEVRWKLKALILACEVRFIESRNCAKSCDILGMFLISVMMLDKLIVTLRKGYRGHVFDLEKETVELCTQMLKIELDASDLDPEKDLLLAFRRQTNYTLPSCDV